MNGAVAPALYVISGFTLLTALQHALASRGASAGLRPVHQLFATMCLLFAAMIFCRAEAYGAEAVDAFIELRRWEATFLVAALPFFLWFVALYTNVRPHRFLALLCLFWVGILVLNFLSPYGIQFAARPDELDYFQLPWGETVVHLQTDTNSPWYLATVLSIQILFYFSLHAAWTIYRRGEHGEGARLGIALFVYLLTAIFNNLVNFGIVDFIHISDFGIVGLIVIMAYQLMQLAYDDNRRAREIMDHLPVAISVKDRQGRYIHINSRFAKMFGVRMDSTRPVSDAEVFHPDLALSFSERDEEVVRTKAEAESEYDYDLGHQKARLKLYQFPIFRGRRLIGLAGLHIDITADRHKDAALEQLRLQVWRTDRLANSSAISKSLAHELSQPLSAILNNAQAGLHFLASDPTNVEEIRDILEDIVRDEKRAGAVVNNLRSMLQNRDEPFGVVDLEAAIREMVDFLHTELIQRSVTLTLELEPEMQVWANKTQIQQVLINLIFNGVEAMEAVGKGCRALSIASWRSGSEASIVVRDCGHGIPPESLDLIFDGFYSTKANGLGIGLEICRGIMESHGGKIFAENNSDQGASFTFSLPISAGAAPRFSDRDGDSSA